MLEVIQWRLGIGVSCCWREFEKNVWSMASILHRVLVPGHSQCSCQTDTFFYSVHPTRVQWGSWQGSLLLSENTVISIPALDDVNFVDPEPFCCLMMSSKNGANDGMSVLRPNGMKSSSHSAVTSSRVPGVSGAVWAAAWKRLQRCINNSWRSSVRLIRPGTDLSGQNLQYEDHCLNGHSLQS